MSDAQSAKGLRERLAGGTEDRLGKAITDLFDNPLVNGALGRASDAREKAAQAQELAMGALNLPSAADIERLTRRLRAVSQRLEGIEDGVHRIGRTLSSPPIEARLTTIEEQLRILSGKLRWPKPRETRANPRRGQRPAAKPTAAKPKAAKPDSRQADPGAKRRRNALNQRAERRAAHRPGGGEQRVVVDVLLLLRRILAEHVGHGEHARHRDAGTCARPQTGRPPPSRRRPRRPRASRARARSRTRRRGRCSRSWRMESRSRRRPAPPSALCPRRSARPPPGCDWCRPRRATHVPPPDRRAPAPRRVRRTCPRGSRAARRARSARGARSPPRGPPCRCSGSSAASRRRSPGRCSPTGRGGG